MTPIPKDHDQPLHTSKGSPTENGKFFNAVAASKAGERHPEIVKAYEKIHPGVWSFNGFFKLTDTWFEPSGKRKVVKFKLELSETTSETNQVAEEDHTRMIHHT